MSLIIHIFIALFSIAYTSFLYIKPTKARFAPAYVLLGSTLASGTYLVASTGNNILKSCMTGLLYLMAVSVAIFLAKKKLAIAENSNQT